MEALNIREDDLDDNPAILIISQQLEIGALTQRVCTLGQVVERFSQCAEGALELCRRLGSIGWEDLLPLRKALTDSSEDD